MQALQKLCLESSALNTILILIYTVYNYPNVVNKYGDDGQPCCPANTFCPGRLLFVTRNLPDGKIIASCFWFN